MHLYICWHILYVIYVYVHIFTWTYKFSFMYKYIYMLCAYLISHVLCEKFLWASFENQAIPIFLSGCELPGMRLTVCTSQLPCDRLKTPAVMETPICIHIHMYIYTYICMHVCVYMYIFTWIYTYVYLFVVGSADGHDTKLKPEQHRPAHRTTVHDSFKMMRRQQRRWENLRITTRRVSSGSDRHSTWARSCSHSVHTYVLPREATTGKSCKEIYRTISHPGTGNPSAQIHRHT